MFTYLIIHLHRYECKPGRPSRVHLVSPLLSVEALYWVRCQPLQLVGKILSYKEMLSRYKKTKWKKRKSLMTEDRILFTHTQRHTHTHTHTHTIYKQKHSKAKLNQLPNRASILSHLTNLESVAVSVGCSLLFLQNALFQMPQWMQGRFIFKFQVVTHSLTKELDSSGTPVPARPRL